MGFPDLIQECPHACSLFRETGFKLPDEAVYIRVLYPDIEIGGDEPEKIFVFDELNLVEDPTVCKKIGELHACVGTAYRVERCVEGKIAAFEILGIPAAGLLLLKYLDLIAFFGKETRGGESSDPRTDYDTVNSFPHCPVAGNVQSPFNNMVNRQDL